MEEAHGETEEESPATPRQQRMSAVEWESPPDAPYKRAASETSQGAPTPILALHPQHVISMRLGCSPPTCPGST